MHWWWDGGWSWWGWLFMMIGMVVVWGLVIWSIASIARTADRLTNAPTPSPEEILARRCAAGEIDEQEYHDRVESLEPKVPSKDRASTRSEEASPAALDSVGERRPRS